ncbi:hypothetical protein [Burkholderia sp. Ac-20365]|uniref:hypothetical protein n=1 Tax=Burkholderia sp. Ac-20365 TaxID=2703897 RepID=UPI00197C4E70|nr:hypothetical protein [Burkholderia sp. Ac-20365]MBN3763901.1 hypothetical protein [Burkholderia sp. Ac-20365]
MSRHTRIDRVFFDEPADSNEFDRLMRLKPRPIDAQPVYFSGEMYAKSMTGISKLSGLPIFSGFRPRNCGFWDGWLLFRAGLRRAG